MSFDAELEKTLLQSNVLGILVEGLGEESNSMELAEYLIAQVRESASLFKFIENCGDDSLTGPLCKALYDTVRKSEIKQVKSSRSGGVAVKPEFSGLKLADTAPVKLEVEVHPSRRSRFGGSSSSSSSSSY
jgi:altronate dehydratase